MSSERKHSSRRNAKARIYSVVFFTNNAKPLSFLLSVLLVALLYLTSTNRSYSSPYVSRRFGLGAGDTSGELRAALRRKGDGRAAVAIIRITGMKSDDPKSVQYLVQMKSHDYPIEKFRGTICLLGGNANKRDETPLDTLKRELNEELHNPDWVAGIDETNVVDDSRVQFSNKPLFNSSSVVQTPASGTRIRYLGTTLHFQSAGIIQKATPYAFVCALYEITLRPDQLPPSAIYPRGANVQEGRVVLLTEDQLIKHSKHAWGYEYTWEKYFGKKTVNKQKGTAMSEVGEETWKETGWTPSK